MKNITKVTLAVSAFACSALFSFGWSEQDGISLSVESAQARIGRPLTPVSVAGVARRQYRRSVYGTGVVGAGVVGAAAIGTTAAVAATAPYYGRAGYYAGGPYYQGGRYYSGGPYATYGYSAQDYAARNGFVCQPGTMTKLDDGRMYPCQ